MTDLFVIYDKYLILLDILKELSCRLPHRYPIATPGYVLLTVRLVWA
jgi:hypothetical protein